MMNKNLFIIFLLLAAAIMPVTTNTTDQPGFENIPIRVAGIPYEGKVVSTSTVLTDDDCAIRFEVQIPKNNMPVTYSAIEKRLKGSRHGAVPTDTAGRMYCKKDSMYCEEDMLKACYTCEVTFTKDELKDNPRAMIIIK